MINLVVFDMDGVLIDSEDLSISIGIKFFQKMGRSLEKKDFLPHLGTGEYDFFSGPAKDNEISFDMREASAFFKSQYKKEIRKKSLALDGAFSFIERVKRAGLKIAIASSAKKWKVEENLRNIGFEPSFFDAVITEEDIKRNKPYSDIYLLALIKCAESSENAVVFEDARGGIRAAKSAGIRTVSLTTTIGKKDAEDEGADAIINNLADIPDFSSSEELESFLFSTEAEEVLYGVNYIKPLERNYSQSVLDKMAFEKAKKARENAYAPYSGYKVGAALISAASGRIYSGCNVENSSYGAAICAERNAVTTALAEEGKLGIDTLIVVSSDNPPAPPCAICLQVLAEFSKSDTRVILSDTEGNKEVYLFKDLLPKPFIFPTMRK
ncbi:MAG TPA: cytidine deaminase [Candidatus Ornithospirochaeta avicola]|uniref:Cytidine deaminase n=1 Tax=Candidatus Ornithospirochaeta avicola TaxID=2840896 RepID=A0A9D1TME0_9SPIO|nr:cytidine deaminase [Candidatus Ornithospirochaeta avicola]